MRVSCNPQFILGSCFEAWLHLSVLHPIVTTIVARVLPKRFGAYRPTVACAFLLLSEAVYTVCSLILADALATVHTGLARCLT